MTKKIATKKFDQEAAFKEFWNRYPKKTAKEAAHKAFLKNVTDELTFNAVLYAIDTQNDYTWGPMIEDGKKQYVPYPATWLNGHRWEDEINEYEPNSIFDRMPF